MKNNSHNILHNTMTNQISQTSDKSVLFILRNSMCINCVHYKNNDTPISTHHKKENTSGGFPASSDNASFIIRPACTDMSERCDVRAHVCVYTQPGLDSCTRVCGKHRWLLLLLLPPDLCDLLHKDNRAASYPQNPPPTHTHTQKQPGLAGLPPFELSDRTISTASTTTSLLCHH